MNTVLQLLKLDLGISHALRDAYFYALLEANKSELESKGFKLDLDESKDQILLSDYTAWTYRKRAENMPIAKSLDTKIKNRIVKARADNYVG